MGTHILKMTFPFVFLLGCSTHTGTGALVGGGLGAMGGAAITGSGTGALIGAGLGVAAGALVGAVLDAEDRKALDRESPRTTRKIDRGEQLSTTDVKKMSKAGLSDDVIIHQIDATHSVFHLSSADIIDLKKAGVSQRIINHMIQTSP